MATPKLSICVPTYNRAIYIDRLLQSISRNNKLDRVEVCISDNASDDHTGETVKMWQSKALFRIKYHRNNSNLGADKNYFKCIEMAGTQYCWLMGSDDQLTPDSIEYIMPKLHLFDIALVQSKPLAVHKNYGGTLTYSHILKHIGSEDINIKALSCYSDVANYFQECRDLRGVFSYLSSVVFDKKSVNPLFDNTLEGSLYSHVKPLIQRMISSECNVAYIPRALVINQRGNDSFLETWVQRSLIDFKGYLKVADSLQLPCHVNKCFTSILNREHPPYRTFLIYSFTKLQHIRKDLELLSYMSRIPSRAIWVDIFMYALSFPSRLIYSMYKALS